MGETVITVRHDNKVGVLARVLRVLRDAGLNVEQMSNAIFARGKAASAAINLTGVPDASTLAAIEALPDVIGVSTGSLTGPRPSLRPFDGYLPRPDLAHRVTAPPLSSITVDRYERLVANYPRSILRVMRSAIVTITGGRERSEEDEVGAGILAGLIDEGALEGTGRPAYYVYRYHSDGHAYTGLLAEVATTGLADGTIRPHEATRTETEDLVLQHFRTVRAHSDPVAMMYRTDRPLHDLLDDIAESEAPRLGFESFDGAHHTLWVVDSEERIAAISGRLAVVDRLYVTDGHHRAAAARRYALERAARDPDHDGTEPYEYLPAMLFADDEVGLEGYHRALTDLGGTSPAQFLEDLAGVGVVEEITVRWANEARPQRPGQIGMLLDGAWYRLTLRESPPDADAFNRLDVVRLQREVLEPLLGVADPETDPRLEYVPGPAGLGEFARRGVAVGFALHQPSTQAIMAVADAGKIMPPKSTWFEPKLRAGLVVRRF